MRTLLSGDGQWNNTEWKMRCLDTDLEWMDGCSAGKNSWLGFLIERLKLNDVFNLFSHVVEMGGGDTSGSTHPLYFSWQCCIQIPPGRQTHTWLSWQLRHGLNKMHIEVMSEWSQSFRHFNKNIFVWVGVGELVYPEATKIHLSIPQLVVLPNKAPDPGLWDMKSIDIKGSNYFQRALLVWFASLLWVLTHQWS